MDTFLSSRTVGRLTVTAGILGFVGLAFLLLFYGLEASKIMAEGEPARPPLFGTLNDATFILVGLLLIPAALFLVRRLGSSPGVLAYVAAACGLSGLLGMAITQALYVPRILSSQQQAPIISAIFGVIGLWVILTSIAHPGLPQRVFWLGVVAGAGMLALTLTFFVGGGAEFSNNPQAGMPGLPVMIGFGLGLLGSSIGWPLWMIWLGIDFMRV